MKHYGYSRVPVFYVWYNFFMEEIINIRNLAHLGDSVYELFVREYTITQTQNIKKLHKLTVSFVNAEFQANLLDKIEPDLNEKESDIVRRGRNLAVTTSKRINHKTHRIATAFEALLGYLYLYDKERLEEILAKIKPLLIHE